MGDWQQTVQVCLSFIPSRLSRLFPYFLYLVLSLSVLPDCPIYFMFSLLTPCSDLAPYSPSLRICSYSTYLMRTHHTPTHHRPVDSLGGRRKLVSCSHRCGCHMRSCLDREVSWWNLEDSNMSLNKSCLCEQMIHILGLSCCV